MRTQPLRPILDRFHWFGNLFPLFFCSKGDLSCLLSSLRFALCGTLENFARNLSIYYTLKCCKVPKSRFIPINWTNISVKSLKCTQSMDFAPALHFLKWIQARSKIDPGPGSILSCKRCPVGDTGTVHYRGLKIPQSNLVVDRTVLESGSARIAEHQFQLQILVLVPARISPR